MYVCLLRYREAFSECKNAFLLKHKERIFKCRKAFLEYKKALLKKEIACYD